MKLLLCSSLVLTVFSVTLLGGEGLPQNPAGNRQVGVGGISFAIPALSLLAGNNGIGGGNGLFGTATVTRTVVSTVSTVTTVAFRTCLAATANLMPCVPGQAAGRRKREACEDEGMPMEPVKGFSEIEATPTVKLIIGATTISDPVAVTKYMEAHKPSLQSVIYPKDAAFLYETVPQINRRMEVDTSAGETTVLYPSQDTPDDATESSNNDEYNVDDESISNDQQLTTETPILQDQDDIFQERTTPEGVTYSFEGDNDLVGDKARRGFIGKTTTFTTVIRVTSVATSLATGPMATVSVSYAGCLPPSLPYSGIPCAP